MKCSPVKKSTHMKEVLIFIVLIILLSLSMLIIDDAASKKDMIQLLIGLFLIVASVLFGIKKLIKD